MITAAAAAAALPPLLALLAGCGSSGGHPAATAPPATTPATPPSGHAVMTSCALGFDDNGTFLALNAANDSHPRAEQVMFVNHGSNGVTIGSFSTSVSYQGRVVKTQLASAFAPNIPYFLIPGTTYAAVIDLSHLSQPASIATSTYLHSTCAVTGWTGG
jgi:hypothetical protein